MLLEQKTGMEQKVTKVAKEKRVWLMEWSLGSWRRKCFARTPSLGSCRTPTIHSTQPDIARQRTEQRECRTMADNSSPPPSFLRDLRALLFNPRPSVQSPLSCLSAFRGIITVFPLKPGVRTESVRRLRRIPRIRWGLRSSAYIFEHLRTI